MLPVLIAVVVLVGVIAGLNLLLTVGVIRRLREHTEQLANMGPGMTMPGRPSPGDEIGEFTTTALDSTMVNRAELDSYEFVTVLSPGCGPCEEKLPTIVKLLESGAVPKKKVLAVIAGEEAEAAPMVTALGDLAVVVRETPVSGAVQSALEVRSYPVTLTTEDGKVKRLVEDLGVFEKAGAKA